MNLTRRAMLQGTLSGIVLSQLPVFADDVKPTDDLQQLVGLTTGSFMPFLAKEPATGKLRLLDLPKIMRDDLGMRVLDLMTRTLASMEPDYLEKLRSASESAGCIITNLKMNQPGLDMASPDEATRNKALTEYKQTIDAAQLLGCRWVRPIPGPKRPDLDRLATAYRELIDYAEPKGISLLIENFGWISNDPTAIPTMIEKVGAGLHASPDTGNWTDKNRYEGLAKAFPLAVTCDFKAFPFNAQGEHDKYDLERCFRVGWEAGYRGPWCLEHFGDSLEVVLKGMVRLREMLERWMREAS